MVVPHNLIENVISFSTTDSKRSILRGEVLFTKVDEYCYVTFRKTKGDYNEFKTLSSFGENFSGEGRWDESNKLLAFLSFCVVKTKKKNIFLIKKINWKF